MISGHRFEFFIELRICPLHTWAYILLKINAGNIYFPRVTDKLLQYFFRKGFTTYFNIATIPIEKLR